jgi:hypothetical protein
MFLSSLLLLLPWGPCRDIVPSFANVPAAAVVLIAFGVLALASLVCCCVPTVVMSLLLMAFTTFLVSLLLFASLLLMLFWRP